MSRASLNRRKTKLTGQEPPFSAAYTGIDCRQISPDGRNLWLYGRLNGELYAVDPMLFYSGFYRKECSSARTEKDVNPRWRSMSDGPYKKRTWPDTHRVQETPSI